MRLLALVSLQEVVVRDHAQPVDAEGDEVKERRGHECDEQEVEGAKTRTVVVVENVVHRLCARVTPVDETVDCVRNSEDFRQPQMQQTKWHSHHEHVANDVD